MNSHYTKEEIVQDSFLFVSYKSEDKDIVFDVLDFLIEDGVRLWFDADLVIGNKWTEVVRDLICHPNCCGVIFFNSVESFKSEPVFYERRYTREKIEACKNTDKPFCIFPVNIGQPSTMLLLKAVFASLPDDRKEIERSFPLEYLGDITSLFGNDIIYCYADPNCVDEYKQRLYDNISKALPSVIDKTVLPPTGANSSRSGIELGIRKSTPTGKLPSWMLSEDKRLSYKGEDFIVSGGVAYSTRKISWQQLYFDKDNVYFISRDIVDTRNGGAPLNDWLKGEFMSFTFSEEERSRIKEIRLLAEGDIGRIKKADFFVFSDGYGAESHWWIDSITAGALQKVIKKTGAVYSSGYNFRTKKSGVRPVICISRDYIKELL